MALRVTRVSISFGFFSLFSFMPGKAFRTKIPVSKGYFVKIPAVFKALVRRCGSALVRSLVGMRFTKTWEALYIN